MEQVNGIEPSSSAWQAEIITIILHLQMPVISIFYHNRSCSYKTTNGNRLFLKRFHLLEPGQSLSTPCRTVDIHIFRYYTHFLSIIEANTNKSRVCFNRIQTENVVSPINFIFQISFEIKILLLVLLCISIT